MTYRIMTAPEAACLRFLRDHLKLRPGRAMLVRDVPPGHRPSIDTMIRKEILIPSREPGAFIFTKDAVDLLDEWIKTEAVLGTIEC